MRLAILAGHGKQHAHALLLALVFVLPCVAAQSPAVAGPALPALSTPAQSSPSQSGRAQAVTAAVKSPDSSAPALTPAQQRAAELAADTARLEQLAAELKIAMDKSTKDTLSLSVIKKAQEVEKLAHKVRDEMRASLLGGS